MPANSPDEHELSAAGLDYDESDSGRSGMRDRASSLGVKMVEEGPEALLDEIENLLPEAWRDQIRQFPIAAVTLGLGVGIWLGMKKSDDIIAAGSSMIGAAAMANVSQVMDKFKS